MNKGPYLQMDYKLKYFQKYLERCGEKLFSGIFFVGGRTRDEGIIIYNIKHVDHLFPKHIP
jgi:hypothetical protein